MKVKQFDLVLVTLHPARGSEQRGTRPCVVLRTNAMACAGRMTLVAPLTSKKTFRIFPQEVLIDPSKQNGLVSHSKIKLDQIRVVSLERIRKKLGSTEKKYWKDILGALDAVFDRQQLFAE